LDNDHKIIDLNTRTDVFERNASDGKHEDWEDDYCLLNQGDYQGLKKLREVMAENNPQDIHAQWRLGEAYILCKEYEKAIDYLEPLYRSNSDYVDIQYSILDALFALGKNEQDFKWVSVPGVFRLNKEIMDLCYDYLKGKRKARTLNDVFCSLLVEGYLTFNEEELLNHLIQDRRFDVQNEEFIQSTLLSVSRKQKEDS
jgi:tetratricopeptide (TPR) repeat protein